MDFNKELGFTLTEVFLPCRKTKLSFGFTLAEVLITLGIIGVVAALTLPTLIGNYQKQALATQTRKFYSMMSQAVKQYMADEGVDDLRNTPLASDNYEDCESPEAIESVRNFVTKYLKVVEECDHEANNCFAEKYKSWDGEEKDVFFKQNNYDNRRDYVLSDGSIIRIGYYYNEFPIDLYVDVNGKKGPNRVGYDLWSMSIFYDGSIDEGGVTPDCKQGKVSEFESLCYDGSQNNNTPQEARENRFEGCKVGSYGGCFGHFLENTLLLWITKVCEIFDYNLFFVKLINKEGLCKKQFGTNMQKFWLTIQLTFKKATLFKSGQLVFMQKIW